MVNPVQKLTAVLPVQNAALLSGDGLTMSTEWYQFFLKLFKRTGGAEGPADTAKQAFDLATTALNAATEAQNTATTALGIAENAATVANQAISVSTTTASANTAMQKAANLSDLTNQSTARTNLHVDEVTLFFTVQTATGQAIDMPITRSSSIPASLQNSQTYWQAAATDAVIPIQVIRTDGTFVSIGSITLAANQPFGHVFSFANQVLFNPGDILRLLIPVSSGTGIGISIRTVIL